MKFCVLISLLIFLIASNHFTQSKSEEREGIVTFVSSQNTYVKFDEMNGIDLGDTLYIKSGKILKPVLEIKYTSSKSCAGILLNGKELKINDKVIAVVKLVANKKNNEEAVKDVTETFQPSGEVNTEILSTSKMSESKSVTKGRLSVQSHSNFSNIPGGVDYQRWRYTLSLNADKINQSDLSFSSYINFNYRADDWKDISNNIWRNLKIYDLAFNYEFNETNIVLGRHRNRSISNIGSIDGLQFEKKFNYYYAGAVIGFRPDFSDYNFNSDLFEYGGYLGRSDTLGDGTMENNLAFMQQTNNSRTDRRFIYLQHSNNILNNTYFFASSEIDLYKKIMNVESSEIIFTSFFFSFRYSPARFFSTTLSYDARKNVVYYETYKNFIDSLFENETRQGLNLRTNLRLANNLMVGLNGGYRFRKGDIKTTRNFGGYLSYSAIPVIESSVAVNYNRLLTNYVETTIYGIRVSRNLFNNLADLSLSYRRSGYELIQSDFSTSQNILSFDSSVRINRTLSFNIAYEGVFEKERTFTRLFTGITARL